MTYGKDSWWFSQKGLPCFCVAAAGGVSIPDRSQAWPHLQPAAPALPAKAGAAGPPPPKAPTASQQAKQAQQRRQDAPSFAASGTGTPATSAPSGLFNSLRGAATTLLRPSQQRAVPQGSPSFAASPLWGRSPPPAATPPPAAREAAAAAAAAPPAAPKVVAAVKSNPLWKWARLGAAKEAAALAVSAAEQPQLQALKRYAKLGGGGVPRATQPTATSSLAKAAALLQYAKLRK